MSIHAGLSTGDIHIPYQYTYANASARNGASLTSADVGKIALQTDNNTFWVCVSYSPVIWRGLSKNAVYTATSDPGATNDGADTAGVKQSFYPGDLWHNTSTQIMWLCLSGATSAAVWKAIVAEPYSNVHNAPTTLLVTDNTYHDVLTMTVGARYTFVLKNASDSDGGSVSNWVEGWILTAASGQTPGQEGGQPVEVNRPYPVEPVSGKTHLYFVRNSDTPFACRVFVTQNDS